MARPKIGVLIHAPLREQLFRAEDWRHLETLGEVVATDTTAPISVDAACDLLADCEVGIGSWQTPWPNALLLDACPKLRLWEHAAGTVKHFFGPHLDGRNLTIASCKTAIADCVAEMTLAEIILGLRGVFPNAAANRKAIAAKPARMRVLFGSTIGVIGASEVGRRVIRRLAPFEPTILLYDPFVSDAQARELGVTLVEDLFDLCRACDVVTLHTPDIPACRPALSAPHFAAMQDDAIFINTSRGACIDEPALIAELERGRLFAFLDVSAPEPAPADSPLRSLPNVVYTSHIAGPPATLIGRQAVRDVEAFLSGGSPLCVVTADTLAHTA